MLVSAWIYASLMGLQQTVAPQKAAASYGWICSAEEEALPGAHVRVSQTVMAPGDASYARIIRVERDWHPGRRRQTLGWAISSKATELAGLDLFSVEVPIKRRDHKGVIQLDYDGGSIGVVHFSETREREQGSISLGINDPTILRAVEKAAWWRIRVIDRKGAVQASVDSALPGRAAIDQAYARLAAALDRQIADPANTCRELGEDAWL